MLKSFPIFKWTGENLVKKKTYEKNKEYPLSRFKCFEHAIKKKIVSKFEHVNFAINEKYSQKHYDNSNYCASFVISNI
jgi:hypothetical protein